MVVNLNDSAVSSSDVSLQRLEKGAWVTVESKTIEAPKEIEKVTFTIKQTTPAAVSYRIYASETEYVTGGASDAFTVSGAKQTAGLTVRYSGKQKYKKSGLKLLVKTTGAYTGTAAVYDGKKKIKTVAVRYGEGTVKLPKNLKKGTHKISVKFTPGGEYKGIYKEKTSAVKRIIIRIS
jgi:hypothetical protein